MVVTTASPSLTPELRTLADELREAERLRRPIPPLLPLTTAQGGA